jgi:YVTN family beta-propeller protein
VATIPLGGGAQPHEIAFNPQTTSEGYVTASNNKVYVFNTSSQTVTTNITVGTNPQGLDVTPNGSTLYVSNFTGGVSVIDTATRTVVHTVATGTQGAGVAVQPGGAFVYVVNPTGNVSVIDTSTNLIVATITVGNTPEQVAFTSDGAKAYVTNQNSNNVSVIETSTRTIIHTIAIPTAFGITILPSFVPLNPPSNFRGKQLKDDFRVIYELYNRLTWDPTTSASATGYHLYRNGAFIANLGIDTLSYEDHDRKKGEIVTYALATVSGTRMSPFVTIEVP